MDVLHLFVLLTEDLSDLVSLMPLIFCNNWMVVHTNLVNIALQFLCGVRNRDYDVVYSTARFETSISTS